MKPTQRSVAGQPPSAEELAWRLRLLLTHAGTQQPCSKCGASVFWLQNQRREDDARAAAFDTSGVNHVLGCPSSAYQLLCYGKDTQHLYRAIEAVLKAVGDLGKCRGCGADIWWVEHLDSSKRAPYTPEGLNHFADCKNAEAFRRGA